MQDEVGNRFKSGCHLASAKIAAVVKNVPAQVDAAVATKEVGEERPVLIMAQDEGCFGRISRPKRCWAPPGVRPHARTQVVREYLYAYAAVPLGQTPVLRVSLTRDHLFAMGGSTEEGRIFLHVQERAYRSEDVVRFFV